MATSEQAASAAKPARRRLHFDNFDQVVAEIERLHAAPYRTSGNWTLPVAVGHLGQAMIGSVDGKPFQVPLWIKIIGRLYFRRKLVKGPFPSGFKLPRSAEAKLVPRADLTYEEGMARLRAGIERLGETTQRCPHPVAGTLSVEQWNQLHLRHAELHLGFFVPE